MVEPPRQSPRGIKFQPVRRYPIIGAVPIKHPFVRKNSVTLEEVVQEPILAYSRAEFPDYHQMLRRIAGPLTKKLHIAEECDGVMSLIPAIESGKGVNLIAASITHTAGRRLRYVPVAPGPPSAVIGLAYMSGKTDRLRQLIREAVQVGT